VFICWILIYAKCAGDRMPMADSQSESADAEKNSETRLPVHTCALNPPVHQTYPHMLASPDHPPLNRHLGHGKTSNYITSTPRSAKTRTPASVFPRPR